MRHFNLTVDDAHAIYKTLKTIFDPDQKAEVHDLFVTTKRSDGLHKGGKS